VLEVQTGHTPEEFAREVRAGAEPAGRKRLAEVRIPDSARAFAAQLCITLGTDGLRGDLTLVRAARALAALQGDTSVDRGHMQRVAVPALRHRLRRNPLDDSGSSTRVERALSDLSATPTAPVL
jgi:magnesium chelatase subunit I